jgi:hypothetical protein
MLTFWQTFGDEFRVITTVSVDRGHGETLKVQTNTLFPKPRPETGEAGLVGLATVPEPDIRVQIPVGLLAARLDDAVNITWSGPACAVSAVFTSIRTVSVEGFGQEGVVMEYTNRLSPPERLLTVVTAEFGLPMSPVP